MAEIGEFAIGWGSDSMPKAQNDVITGKVTELSMGNGDYGPYPIVTLVLSRAVSNQQPGTEVALHCFHTALRNKIEELRPIPSETIAVKYHGERVSKDGKRTYQAYSVKMIGRTQTDFWGTPVPQSDVTPAEYNAPTTQSVVEDDDIPF